MSTVRKIDRLVARRVEHRRDRAAAGSRAAAGWPRRGTGIRCGTGRCRRRRSASSAATSSRRPALTITAMRMPSLVTGGLSLHRGIFGAALLAGGELGLERLLASPASAGRRRSPRRRRAARDRPRAISRRTLRDPPEHRHAHRPRDDGDVRGQRAFLEDHALQLAPVIFEQFGGPEIARDQDRILRQAHLRGGAELAGDDPEQPVGEIVQIVHPVLQQRIVDLAHAHARCAGARARSPPRRSGRNRSPR